MECSVCVLFNKCPTLTNGCCIAFQGAAGEGESEQQCRGELGEEEIHPALSLPSSCSFVVFTTFNTLSCGSPEDQPSVSACYYWKVSDSGVGRGQD